MKDFCENSFCQNPGSKVVPISADTPSDGVRTLCATCEEAYAWGFQHGRMAAEVERTKTPSPGRAGKHSTR